MPTVRDKAFAQAVVEARLASRQQVQQCLDEVAMAEGTAEEATVDSLMVKNGMISREQADAVLGTLNKNRAPGTIGGFEFLERPSSGWPRTTCKAKQISTGRIVALRASASEPGEKHAWSKQFSAKARLLERLGHDNIVEVVEVGEASGYHYIATEYVEGETLEEKLERQGVIVEAEALQIAEGVCLALEHFHTNVHITHGGVNPKSIILSADGVVKLGDFGPADPDGGAAGYSVAQALYISPEVACNSPDVDIRSDIYSLGAVFFHMVAGEPPFSGPDASSIITKHVTAPVPVPSNEAAAVSTRTCKMIWKMLGKYPRNRYEDPTKLLEEIRGARQSLAQGKEPTATHQPDREPPTFTPAAPESRAIQYSAAALAAVILLCTTALIVFRRDDSPPPRETEVIVDPKQEKDPPVQDPRELAAAEDYDSAIEYEKAYPNDIMTIREEFEYVAQRYPGTISGEKAKGKVKEIDDRITEKFEGIRKEANDLVDKKLYARAIEAWAEYPEELLFDPWSERVSHEKEEINRKAKDSVAKLFEEADKLAKEQRFQESIGVLETGYNFGLDDVKKDIERKIAEYKQELEETSLARDEKMNRAFAKSVHLIVQRERDRKFELALEACDAFLADQEAVLTQEEESVADVSKLKEEIQVARDMWEKVRAALPEARGKKVELRKKGEGITWTGLFRRITDAAITIEVNRNEVTLQLSDIELRPILDLAGVTGADQEAMVGKVCFLLAGGDVADAQETVGTFANKRLKVKWTAWIARRGVFDCFGRSLGYAQDGKWKELYITLSECGRVHAECKAFKALQRDREKLLLEAEAGLCEQLGITRYTPGEFVALLGKLPEVLEWLKKNPPKTLPCARCNGKGKTTLKEICGRCDGRGWLICAKCRGDGVILGVRCTCAKGRTVCPACDAKRIITTKQKCGRCDGTGVGRPAPRPEMPLRLREALDTLKHTYNLELKDVIGLLKE